MSSTGTPQFREFFVRAAPVLTLRSDSNRAAGFLVRDGVISELYEDRDRADERLKDFDGPVLDYGNRPVLPGFTDAHTHMISFGKALREVDLEGVRSVEEVRTRIRSAMDRFEDRDWILGRGWNPNMMSPDRWPHRSDLADLDTSKPIALQSHDQHAYWLNQQALSKLGIDKQTSAPSGGEVVKDDAGRPTGILKERAMELVDAHFQKKEGDDQTAGTGTRADLKRAIDAAFRAGVTSVHDIGYLNSYDLYRDLLEENHTTPRVAYFCCREDWSQVEERDIQPGQGNEFLRFAGLKLFADGTLGAQTAAMIEPFHEQLNDEQSRGTLIHDPDDLEEWAVRAAEREFAVAIHAIGDRGVRVSLDALEAAGDRADPVAPHRVEHAQLVHPEDLDRFRSLNVIASIQPCHIYQDRNVADRVWGERESIPFPVRTLLDRGADVYFGTDVPIEEISPFHNLQAAVHRGRSDEDPWRPSEAVSTETALTLACRDPASYLFQNRRGTLSEGTPADYVVLSKNPFDVAPDELGQINVLETRVQGGRMFASDELNTGQKMA